MANDTKFSELPLNGNIKTGGYHQSILYIKLALLEENYALLEMSFKKRNIEKLFSDPSLFICIAKVSSIRSSIILSNFTMQYSNIKTFDGVIKNIQDKTTNQQKPNPNQNKLTCI